MIVSALCFSFFSSITTPSNNRAGVSNPFVYFSEPTKYGKYLRTVLMSWIVDDEITVTHVAPTHFMDAADDSPASDSDDEPDVIQLPEGVVIDEPSTSSPDKPTKKDKAGRFPCPSCENTYGSKHDLKRHTERIHKTTFSSGNCVCMQCGYRCFKIEKLREHLTVNHGVDMDVETSSFESCDEFEEWKCDLEESNKCNYVKMSGEQGTKFEVQYSKCTTAQLHKHYTCQHG